MLLDPPGRPAAISVAHDVDVGAKEKSTGSAYAVNGPPPFSGEPGRKFSRRNTWPGCLPSRAMIGPWALHRLDAESPVQTWRFVIGETGSAPTTAGGEAQQSLHVTDVELLEAGRVPAGEEYAGRALADVAGGTPVPASTR